MKKVIALLLAVLYFVFTTFTLWEVNDEDNRFRYTADSHKSAIADTGPEKAINIEILAATSLSRTLKHLSVSGKIKLPRASSVVPASRNFLSSSSTGYYKMDISRATAVLHQTSIYLKNGVLRI